MPHRAITTLQQTLRPHVGLSKSRLETLCLIVVGMVSARTVNLSHLACERPTTALVASTYRRLQRFFQHVCLGADWSAPLVVGLLGLDGPWCLALDRTQWKCGARDVNILMLAVVTRRARVPLIWSVLDNNGGTSDSGQRIALMRRYLAIFGAASIRLLLADREFVGRAWMNFLNENNIPFAIRMKEKLIVTTEDGRRLALGSALRKCRGVRTFRAALGPRRGLRSPVAELRRQASRRWRAPHHRLQHPGPRRPRGLSQTLGHRMPLRRHQDPRPQSRGHPARHPPQARPAPRPRRSRNRLGRQDRRDPRRTQAPAPQNPRIPRKVLVPHRLRPAPKAAPS